MDPTQEVWIPGPMVTGITVKQSDRVAIQIEGPKAAGGFPPNISPTGKRTIWEECGVELYR